ncbi:hypothetical protein ACVWZZ_008346 [Bradyrhizobium sp. LM6.10]
MEILIERTGDKALHQFIRDDALAFADWWEERVITEGIGAGTANKNITHIGGMIRAVNKRLKLGLDDVFAGHPHRGPSRWSTRHFLRGLHPPRYPRARQAR